MKHRYLRALLLVGLGLVLVSCSITRVKWRIKWDKDMEKSKAAFMGAPLKVEQERQPNIILLVADDLGPYEVSAYGVKHISTPNIDQIGAEGVVFEEGYATAPTCAPARAGLMTGRVQNRYGFETQVMEFYPSNYVEYISGRWLVDTGEFKVKAKPSFPSAWQVHKQGVPPSEIMLSEILKKYDYSTALIGKWHLGIHREQVPHARGFDYQYGFYGASSLYTPEENWSGVINHKHKAFSAQHQWKTGAQRTGGHHAQRRGDHRRGIPHRCVPRRDDEVHGGAQGRAVSSSTARSRRLTCPSRLPVEYYCQYPHVEDENKRVYYAMISSLDDAIGEIHQKVKDLGIEEDTLIFFISDNGGASYTHATDNGPLKAGKLTQFEGGIRIPFMMKWKGKIPAGHSLQVPSVRHRHLRDVGGGGGRRPSKRPRV